MHTLTAWPVWIYKQSDICFCKAGNIYLHETRCSTSVARNFTHTTLLAIYDTENIFDLLYIHNL